MRFDKYELYEHSVQDPEHVMGNLARTFRRLRGRDARTLREDFCGTGANLEAWAIRHPDNRAIGIDLDPEPLAWGTRRRFGPAVPTQYLGADRARCLLEVRGAAPAGG